MSREPQMGAAEWWRNVPCDVKKKFINSRAARIIEDVIDVDDETLINIWKSMNSTDMLPIKNKYVSAFYNLSGKPDPRDDIYRHKVPYELGGNKRHNSRKRKKPKTRKRLKTPSRDRSRRSKTWY